MVDERPLVQNLSSISSQKMFDVVKVRAVLQTSCVLRTEKSTAPFLHVAVQRSRRVFFKLFTPSQKPVIVQRLVSGISAKLYGCHNAVSQVKVFWCFQNLDLSIKLPQRELWKDLFPLLCLQSSGSI